LNPNKPPTTPAPGQLLRLPAVESLTQLKKTTIYTHMANKADPFPAPIRIGARAVAWRLSDVEAWIEARPSFKPQGGDK
jgi:prophage regulatory protein